ncbi:MAG: GntR family transcriptional regulator [Edaphobacter sp.]|uniref:GntR family transcriptional regulator n=1 Tax=Edaphobacter sp. TaxID=1934404 RepID=UPI0023A502F4|nr:GntR family transcriptional regulator [Edaphobacter sp.]MDE1177518.1 GntR family transcriptional regulator [Edaphobacter sp.]
MSARIREDQNPEKLLKSVLADKLRRKILRGELRPGDRVVENRWAREFQVAQASVREAINILIQDGFVSKAEGRSARVTNLTKDDVLLLYELRGALEGLAARRAAELGADLSQLQNALQAMRAAAKKNDMEALLDAELAFHLSLVASGGNKYVIDQARRILVPFFAFVRIRVMGSGQGADAWNRDLEIHGRILDLIQDGEAEIAERFLHRAMARFAANAYENWEKKSSSN